MQQVDLCIEEKLMISSLSPVYLVFGGKPKNQLYDTEYK